jgi:hypothetical protein
MELEHYDEETFRCPRIGDFVPFKYCRTSGNPFCWIIIKCWAPKIDIGQFLADNYSAEVIHQGLKRPEGGKYGKIVGISDKYRD